MQKVRLAGILGSVRHGRTRTARVYTGLVKPVCEFVALDMVR